MAKREKMHQIAKTYDKLVEAVVDFQKAITDAAEPTDAARLTRINDCLKMDQLCALMATIRRVEAARLGVDPVTLGGGVTPD